MKLLSQIGTHTSATPIRSSRLRRIIRRVRWGYVAWAAMFLMTAGIALYAIRAMVHMIDRASAL